MPVHRRVTPSIKFVGTHLYTWVERGTVKVKCIAQEHNTMTPARARTRSALTMRPPRLHTGGGGEVGFSINNSVASMIILVWGYFLKHLGTFLASSSFDGQRTSVFSNTLSNMQTHVATILLIAVLIHQSYLPNVYSELPNEACTIRLKTPPSW